MFSPRRTTPLARVCALAALAVLAASSSSGCYLSSEPHDDVDGSRTGIRVDVEGVAFEFGVESRRAVEGARVLAERCSDGLQREGITDAEGAVYLDFDAIDCWTITAVDAEQHNAVTFVEAPAPLGRPILLPNQPNFGLADDFEWRELTITGRSVPGSTVSLSGTGVAYARPPSILWATGLSTSDDRIPLAQVPRIEGRFVLALERVGDDVVQAALLDLVPPIADVTVALPGSPSPRRPVAATVTLPTTSMPDLHVSSTAAASIARPSGLIGGPRTGRADVVRTDLVDGDVRLSLGGSEPDELAGFAPLAGAMIFLPLEREVGSSAGNAWIAEGDELRIPALETSFVDGARARDLAIDVGGAGAVTSVIFAAKQSNGATRFYVVVGPDDRPLVLSGLPPWPSRTSLDSLSGGRPIEVSVRASRPGPGTEEGRSTFSIVVDRRTWD